MSKGRLLITLLLSTLMGLGALILANNWLEQKQANYEPNQVEAEQVEVVREVIKEVVKEETKVAQVTAIQLLPSGTILESKHLTIRNLPEDAIPPSGFENIHDVVGKVVKNEILKGEVLRQERLVSAGEGTTLAALISPNMRAVTIRVNDVIGVAGFLLPGDYVDVIYTKENMSRAQTVLKRIKILAVDQTAKANASDPIIVRAVTLELTPRQAESLVTVKSKGELQLSLRNPNDPIVKPRVYKKTTDSVTIIKGTQTSRINVKI
ncbi:Flp pilus assembly protein CpaB [Photobacterium sp. BZF1]|uniref:Flp pilus assembly protein CpaB n=1 Tax=Photobacterium sp. BZF1 TaxID=1904457 RepID=UPI001653D2A6|nr:Flp pilus assembly protein CpaB [Photobacterium sp. BZF1]MBC7002829.1 Flp pilus assembly protein CpaB [Photobacterium sp. BZF1]